MKRLPQDSLVLALDSSTDVVTTALLSRHEDSFRPVAERSATPGRAHTRLLMPLVDEVMWEAGAEPDDLAAVVVGTGPGTFTGVRIAVAAGRALALALSVPITGVSTLAALAACALLEDAAGDGVDLLVPVVDARRGEHFAAFYRPAEQSSREGGRARASAGSAVWRRKAGPLALRPDGVARHITDHFPGSKTLVVGRTEELRHFDFVTRETPVRASCLLVGQCLLEEPGEQPAEHQLKLRLSPRTRLGGRPAAAKPGETGSPELVVPTYVRPPDADRHITKMRDPWLP